MKIFEKDHDKRINIYQILEDPWITCNGREEVNLDLEESSEVESSLALNEDCAIPRPHLLSNMPSTYREDDLDIGTINDETENSIDEGTNKTRQPLTAIQSCPINL